MVFVFLQACLQKVQGITKEVKEKKVAKESKKTSEAVKVVPSEEKGGYVDPMILFDVFLHMKKLTPKHSF